MITDIIFSDSHENPSGVSDNLVNLVRRAKFAHSDLYSVGDLLNLLPLGKEGWEKWLREFEALLKGYPITLIGGNHDPYNWLKEMFVDMENVTVVRRVNLPNGIHMRHGHSWSPDWWVLRHFAPSVVDFMVEHFPNLWYRFSEWMGWIPSKLQEQGLPQKHSYRKQVKRLWDEGMGYAEKHNCVVILGHTHCQGGAGGRPPMQFVEDCGALKEGDYLIVEEGIVTRCNLHEEG